MAQQLPISDRDREIWQSVGRVTIEGAGRAICTGTLIAPDKVLTAAHCVTNAKTGRIQPFYKVQFVAGWHNGDFSASAKALRVRVHPDYRAGEALADHQAQLRNVGRDVAVIELKTSMVDVVPSVLVDVSAPRGPVAVLGYQRERPEVLTDYVGCAADTDGGPILGLTCKVKSGTSGGPVFQRKGTAWELVGVVVANTGKSNNAVKGLAVRMDKAVLGLIEG